MPCILFVDDHVVIRAGLLTLLRKAMPRMSFLEASNIAEAMQAIDEHDISLVLCDISLGKESGLDLLTRYGQRIRFVMLSIFDEDVYGLRCRDLGAKAYLNKACDPDELVQTILRVLGDEKQQARVNKSNRPLVSNLLLSLSEREREVLEDIANGLTLQEISAKRSLQYSTVKTYKQRVMEKTHCRHNPELLFFALKHGLVQPPN